MKFRFDCVRIVESARYVFTDATRDAENLQLLGYQAINCVRFVESARYVFTDATRDAENLQLLSIPFVPSLQLCSFFGKRPDVC